MSIGIGVTTRNRQFVLDTALKHFQAFGAGDRLVIVDDFSDDQQETQRVIDQYGDMVTLRLSPHRLGIARAKNACLAALTDCDHVFIFDDDAWPKVEGWANKWIEINEHNDVGHSMWNVFATRGPESPEQVRADIQIQRQYISNEFSDGEYAMRAWTQCLGVMLYFNRACLNAIGGYDHSAQTVYGYEHAQVSQRANWAGFTKGHNYLSPAIAHELVYSFDISYGWMHEEAPLEMPWKNEFRTSVTVEEAQAHPKNAFLMSKRDVFIPLIDPIV